VFTPTGASAFCNFDLSLILPLLDEFYLNYGDQPGNINVPTKLS
jgi:hypothetical protein